MSSKGRNTKVESSNPRLLLLTTLLSLLCVVPLAGQDAKTGQENSADAPAVTRELNRSGDPVATAQNATEDESRPEGEGAGLLKTAKKMQNPVSNIYRLQLQSFYHPNMGKNDVAQYSTNVILSVPFHLNRKWDLITRTGVPITNLPAANPGEYHAVGLGDLNPTLYLSPRGSGSISWGVGPSFQFDTATDHMLGAGKQSAGPAGVFVLTTHKWVIASRINNMWSFTGTAGRKDFNQMWIQPFIYYNFRPGWYLSSVPSILANWNGAKGNTWTVPVGGGVGHLKNFGERWTINIHLDAFANAKAPSGNGSWQAMSEVQFILRSK